MVSTLPHSRQVGGRKQKISRQFLLFVHQHWSIVFCVARRSTGKNVQKISFNLCSISFSHLFQVYNSAANPFQTCRASQNTNNKVLSNTPNCHVCAGKFYRYLLMGKVWKKYAKRNGIGVENPANWLVKQENKANWFWWFQPSHNWRDLFRFSQWKKIILWLSKLHITSSFSL